MKTLIKNGTIITVDAQDRVFKKGWILIENDVIAALGEGAPSEDIVADRSVDASGKVVLPGIVNIHTHVSGTLFKALTEDPDNGFYGLAMTMEQYYTEEYAYALSMLGAAECLKSGVTCINDTYHYAKHTAKAVDDLGMRGVIAQQIHEIEMTSIRSGAYTRIEAEGRKRLEENCDLIERYHGKDGRIFCRFGPHAVDTVSLELGREIVDLANRYQVGFHTHAGQYPIELDHLKAKYGLSPMEYLREMGMLGENLIVAHGILLSDTDLKLLEDSGAVLAHCPEIYGKRGFLPAVEKIYDSNIRMGYGTDWVTMDSWTTMRTAIMAARWKGCRLANPNAHTALRLSTIEPAKALGLADRIGSLEVGKQADLQMLDLQAPHLVPMFDDPIATLVYNANRNDVTDVWVAGEKVVSDGKLVKADEAEVLKEGQKAASAIYRTYLENR